MASKTFLMKNKIIPSQFIIYRKCTFVGKWKINRSGFCKSVLNLEREGHMHPRNELIIFIRGLLVNPYFNILAYRCVSKKLTSM